MRRREHDVQGRELRTEEQKAGYHKSRDIEHPGRRQSGKTVDELKRFRERARALGEKAPVKTGDGLERQGQKTQAQDHSPKLQFREGFVVGSQYRLEAGTQRQVLAERRQSLLILEEFRHLV